MKIKSNTHFLFVIVLLFFVSKNSFSQKRLFLVKTFDSHESLIKMGSNMKYQMAGSNHFMKLKLIDVLDSGIILKGSIHGIGTKTTQQFFSIKEITSVRRMNAGHTVARVIGGILVFNGLAAIAASLGEKPPEAAPAIIGGGFILVGMIPFLIPRKQFRLGTKFQLVIK